MEKQAKEEYLAGLRNIILERLHIPEHAVEGEDDIRKLVVLSIRLQTRMVREEDILTAVDRYDCHQTGLAARKKALLLLGIENDLGTRLDDDAAAQCTTITDLGHMLRAAFEKA